MGHAVMSIPEDTVIESKIGMMDLMKQIADYIGLSGGVSELSGPGGLTQINAGAYVAGRKGLEMLGIDSLSPYTKEDSFVVYLSLGDTSLVTHSCYVTRLQGEKRSALVFTGRDNQ